MTGGCIAGCENLVFTIPSPYMLVVRAEQWIELKRYPSRRSQTVRAIQVFVRRTARAELQTTFRLEGDISQICVPPPRPPQFKTQLWRHTCFEAFIAIDGQLSYHEFNFAPSGEWAVYAFSGYRDGGPLADDAMRPQIVMHPAEGRLELDTLIRLDSLSAAHPHASLRVGLSAVIEAMDGMSYWALRHPTSRPDFHNADGFALLLEPSSAEE